MVYWESNAIWETIETIPKGQKQNKRNVYFVYMVCSREVLPLVETYVYASQVLNYKRWLVNEMLTVQS